MINNKRRIDYSSMKKGTMTQLISNKIQEIKHQEKQGYKSNKKTFLK